LSPLFNAHGVEVVRQTEIHTAEPLVSELSAFEVKMAIEELKRCKSPGNEQIQAEFIKAGVEQFAMRSINLLVLLGIRRNCRSTGSS
jgi:hypothetical protein